MLSLKSPLACVWEITNRCNFSCPHCRAYIDAPKENENIEQLIMRELVSNDVLSVNISGGEPLLNKRVFNIISFLYKNGIDVGISTNGFLYKPNAELLKESGLSFIQISLDGPEAIHDSFRGVKGAHKTAIESMQLAKRLGHFVQMNTTITQYNINYAFDNIAIAEQIGVDRIFFRRVVSAGLAERNNDVIPDKSKYISLLMKLIEYKYKANVRVNISIDDPIVAVLDSTRYQDNAMCCSAGITSLGIDSLGNVYPCIFAREKIGNLLDMSLCDIWNNSAVLERIRNRRINVCGNCKHKISCGGCRAANGIFEWDYMCPINETV